MSEPTEKPLPRVPPSINEDVFAPPSAFAEDAFVAAARNVLRTARLAAEKSRVIAQATLANDMETLPRRHKTARDQIFNLTKPALQRFDELQGKLSAEIGRLNEELLGPVAKGNNLPLREMEVRSALAQMTAEQRRAQIRHSLKDGDDMIVAAVLRAPPFLSGLKPEEQAQLRLEWQHAAKPEVVARLEMLNQIGEHLGRGGKLLMSFSMSLTDAKIIQAAELSEKRAQEAAQSFSSATLQ